VTIYLDGARRPGLALCELTAKGLMQLAAGAAWTLLSAEFLSQRRIRGRLLMQHGLGKLSWRRPVGYIQETNGSNSPGARMNSSETIHHNLGPSSKSHV
jgi:hypothetical protein